MWYAVAYLSILNCVATRSPRAVQVVEVRAETVTAGKISGIVQYSFHLALARTHHEEVGTTCAPTIGGRDGAAIKFVSMATQRTQPNKQWSRRGKFTYNNQIIQSAFLTRL